MERVLLVDSMNNFIRAFSALSFTNDSGAHTGAIYGYMQSLVSAISKFQPSSVYIAWEGKGSAERRRKLLKEYKEGRKFTGFNRHFETSAEDEREAFRRQLNIVKEITDNIPVYQGSVDFIEADDLIAYLCRKVLKNRYEKVIMSTDRDYLQLLDEHTIQFRPVKTKKDKVGQLVRCERVDDTNKYNIVYRNFTDEEEFERVRCHPKNHIVVKCIEGDSDNITGIKGVKAKTFLRDFPFLESLKDDGYIYTVQDIVEIAQGQTSDKYKKYVENKELLLLNQQLMQLLDPDISLKSVDTIINSITSRRFSFSPAALRMLLVKDDIVTKHVDRWITVFNSLKNNKIELNKETV